VLDAEPSQPVTVLNHDHGDAGIGEDAVQLAALSVQSGADLFDDLADRQPDRVRALHDSYDLPVQVIFLVARTDSAVCDHTAGRGGRFFDDPRAGGRLAYRNGHLAVLHPPPGSLIAHALPACPLRKLHVTIMHDYL
jgi:hypothetical protein